MIPWLVLASLPALAADAGTEIPTPRVGALVYSHFRYDLTDDNAGYSEFGIDRAFLVAQGQITQQIGAKITIDADLPRDLVGFDASTGTATTDTKMRVFLKNAWLEGKLPAGIKVRAGIVDTGWVAFGEQFGGIRYITRQLADVGKLDSAADFGVNIQGNEAGGLIDWHVGAYNGEGYACPEIDGGKAIAARVALDPLAPGGKWNLPVGGWVKQHFANESAATPSISTTAYAGGAGFKMPYVVAWGEYDGVARSDGTAGGGASITVMPRAPALGGLIFRFDDFDPNHEVDGDQMMTIIGGVSHTFAEKTAVALTFEQTVTGGDSSTASRGVYARWQAGF